MDIEKNKEKRATFLESQKNQLGRLKTLQAPTVGTGPQTLIPTPSGVGSESIISRFFPSDRVGAGRGQNVDYS